MIPGGVMSAPTLSDVTRSTSILENWGRQWLEGQWLGCSVDRWLENKTWSDIQAWMTENESQANSDLAVFIRWAQEIGLDTYGQGYGNFLATGTFLNPICTRIRRWTVAMPRCSRGRGSTPTASTTTSTRCASPKTSPRLLRRHGFASSMGGVTEPIDPAEGAKQGKYTWARPQVRRARHRLCATGGGAAGSPDDGRAGCRGLPGLRPVDQEPDRRTGTQCHDPGAGAHARGTEVLPQCAALAQGTRPAREFYVKPTEPSSGKGFWRHRGRAGALCDWIVLEDGKIANYQVITPTGWNIGPRDANDNIGPMEKSFIGNSIENPDFPVELRAGRPQLRLLPGLHGARHDGKTGKQLSKFRMGGG